MSSRPSRGRKTSDPTNEEHPMAFRPYLAFAGNAREAFTRYQQIFGGELVLLDTASIPPEAGPPPAGTPAEAIMHAALTTPDALLMGADGPVDGTASNNVGRASCRERV